MGLLLHSSKHPRACIRRCYACGEYLSCQRPIFHTRRRGWECATPVRIESQIVWRDGRLFSMTGCCEQRKRTPSLPFNIALMYTKLLVITIAVNCSPILWSSKVRRGSCERSLAGTPYPPNLSSQNTPIKARHIPAKVPSWSSGQAQINRNSHRIQPETAI